MAKSYRFTRVSKVLEYGYVQAVDEADARRRIMKSDFNDADGCCGDINDEDHDTVLDILVLQEDTE